MTRVSLFRGDEHLVLNVRAALETGDQRSNPSLQPGDVVYAPLSDQVLVIGAFPRSGPQPYDAKLTLMDYIARAGGVVSGHLDKGVLCVRCRMAPPRWCGLTCPRCRPA